MVIEGFQYSGLGPDPNILSNIVIYVGRSFGVNLEPVSNQEEGVFWNKLNITYGLIFIW